MGTATETVTVTAEATLLKTETGDMTHNVTLDTNEQSSSPGNRDRGQLRPHRHPQSIQLVADASRRQFAITSRGTYNLNGTLANGLVPRPRRCASKARTRHLPHLRELRLHADGPAERGLDSGSCVSRPATTPPNSEQAGVVSMNMTMKSGTNQYHGSGYDYFVNEDLNAGNPYSH